MITFSIIIPAKNEEEYIGQCVASLLKLNYPREQYEIIVADNGSIDATVAVASISKVNVLDLSKKKTISAVRNGGASYANGKILVFLDADCTVASDWLLQAERYLSQSSIVCFGSSPVIPENATWVERSWFLVRMSQELVFEREWQESTNMFIRKTAFDEINGFNEQLETCEDVDISYRLRKYGSIISDSRIVAVHHRDPKTLWEFFLKEKWRGKNNYSGVLQHGVKIDEIPSLVLPIYFVCMIGCGLIVLLFGGAVSVSGVFVLFAQLPLWALALIKIRKQFNIVNYSRLILLYNIYFIARASAIV